MKLDLIQAVLATPSGKVWGLAAVLAAAAGLTGLFTTLLQRLSTDAFLDQIGKLVRAGNLDRGIKLAAAVGRIPVAALVRIGLEAALRPRGPLPPSQRAVQAMQAAGPALARPALRRALVACVLAAGTAVLALACLRAPAPARNLVLGLSGADVLVALLVLQAASRVRRDLGRVTDGMVATLAPLDQRHAQ